VTELQIKDKQIEILANALRYKSAGRDFYHMGGDVEAVIETSRKEAIAHLSQIKEVQNEGLLEFGEV
jgi:hypothetical protein